jgi:protein-tyrosine kinase
MTRSPLRDLALAQSADSELNDDAADADRSGLPSVSPTEPGALEPAAGLSSLFDPFGRSAEQFRALRVQIGLRMGRAAAGQGQALAVVSPAHGDGRSWLAANLAASMSQRGGRVLLIDADLRRPRLHRLFGLRNAAGLATMLEGRADYRCLRVVPQVPGLHLLSAGASGGHPLELLERPELALVLQQLRLRFAQIVVDTAASESGPDATVVASCCDASVLVARRHKTRTADARRLVDALALAGKPVAGVALNDH